VYASRLGANGTALTPYTIYGSYARLVQKTNVLNGITTTTTMEYRPDPVNYPKAVYSGQLLSQTQDNVNIQGQTETHTTQTAYAYQYYPALDVAGDNVLSAIAQTYKLCVH
jgi:hypothetical protein